MPGGISRYLGGMVGIQEAATVSQAVDSITTALRAEYANAVELAGTNMTMRQICAPFSNSIYQNLKTAETTAKIAQEEGLGVAKQAFETVENNPGLVAGAKGFVGDAVREMAKMDRAINKHIDSVANLFTEEESKLIKQTIRNLDIEAATLQQRKLSSNFSSRVAQKITGIKEKPHWKSLMIEPDEIKKITSKSIIEGLSGIAAEESGLIPGPLQRDPSKAAEFIDRLGRSWDVKTPISFTPDGKRVFKVEHIINGIKRDLQLGENIILNLMRLEQKDTLGLVKALQTNLTANEISRVVTVFQRELL